MGPAKILWRMLVFLGVAANPIRFQNRHPFAVCRPWVPRSVRFFGSVLLSLGTGGLTRERGSPLRRPPVLGSPLLLAPPAGRPEAPS